MLTKVLAALLKFVACTQDCTLADCCVLAKILVQQCTSLIAGVMKTQLVCTWIVLLDPMAECRYVAVLS